MLAAENPAPGFIHSKDEPLPEGTGISALVQKSGRLEIVPNYNDFETGVDALKTGNYESAGVPMRLGDRHIGALTVSMASPNLHFNLANLDILTTLANQAAIAIENARLYSDLGRENEKYRLIAEKASDLIISLDSAGILTYVNERVRSILGYLPVEMTGKPLERYLATEGQVALRDLMQNLLLPHPESRSDGYYSQPQELLAISKDGVPVNLEFNFGLLYQPGRQDQIFGIQGIGRDVNRPQTK